MRTTTVILALLVALHAAQVSGDQAWCMQPGQGLADDTCITDFDCYPLQACANGRCTVNSAGDACETDADCGFSNMGCVGGICKVRRSLEDTCTSNGECASGICDAGTGLCAGRALGAACDPQMVPNQCGYQAFCSHTGVCIAAIASGASCAEHAAAVVEGTMAFSSLLDVCAGSGFCDGGSGQETCKLVLSSGEGEACGPSQYGCNLNELLTCTRASGDTMYGTCERQVPMGSACEGGHECSGGAWCVCNEPGRVSSNGTCQPFYRNMCATEQTNFLLCGIGVHCHRSVASVYMSDHVRGSFNMAQFAYEGSCWNQCLEKQKQFSCCRATAEFADTYPLPFSCTDDGDDDDEGESSGAAQHAPLAMAALLVAVGVSLL